MIQMPGLIRCALVIWAAASPNPKLWGQSATNSWTSPATGTWHDLTWSLNTPPDITQSAILITNAGQKDVVINSQTVVGFPASLSVNNLTISGAPNASNTLVIDHTGAQVPLQVLNRCTVSTNGALLNLGGSLDLARATLIVNGAFHQERGVAQVSENVFIANSSSPALFRLAGDSLTVSGCITVGGSDAVIGQWFGDFYHETGSVIADALMIGAGAAYGTGGSGRYFFQNGTLVTRETTVGSHWGSPSSFTQSSGSHQAGTLSIGGHEWGPGGRVPIEFEGTYSLVNGSLACQSCDIDVMGSFLQSGGTNIVSKTLTSNGKYQLSSGGLFASSLILEGQTAGDAIFIQSGGAVSITNFSIAGGQVFARYSLPKYQVNGGQLTCARVILGSYGSLQISGGSVLCSNLTLAGPVAFGTAQAFDAFNLVHLRGTLVNSGQTIFCGGIANFGNVTADLGSISLGPESTSVILFSGTCTLRFNPSSANQWPSDSLLYFPESLGNSKIYVGNSQDALTPDQLAHIRFGLPWDPHFYQARLLESGQLVPETPFAMTKAQDRLQFSWPQDWYGNSWSLQSATTISGPFSDVFPASGTYSTTTSAPERFFRLRTGPLWSSADIGPVSISGNAQALDGVWTVSGSGPGMLGTVDAFHFAYQPWSGDGSISAQVLTCGTTNPSPIAGVMFRATLDPGSPSYATVLKAAQSQSQWRAFSGDQTSSSSLSNPPLPCWIKLCRLGDSFLGCVSSDSISWTMLNSQNITMPAPICAGLAVSTFTANTLNTACFDHVLFSPNSAPLPWASTDVGAVALPGQTIFSNGTFIVESSGFDCSDTADQFHCVHMPSTGDATLTAHISNFTSGAPSSKAGVMFRDNLSTIAPYSATILTSANGTILQRRYSQDYSTLFSTGPDLQAPCWLKIVRRGNTFYNYVSPDASSWTLIGDPDTVTMAASACAILFVTKHDSPASALATFDSVNISQP